jgi:hypothetical protein
MGLGRLTPAPPKVMPRGATLVPLDILRIDVPVNTGELLQNGAPSARVDARDSRSDLMCTFCPATVRLR